MLPIYNALSFTKILEGGGTKPWLILVDVEGEPSPYVVKLFKTTDIQNGYSVAKEVYCSILANAFDLGVPSPALIKFSDEFIETLPEFARTELLKKDDRIKFGCQYITGSFKYQDSLHRYSLSKYDLESVYAFDNLIKNGDRCAEKPNLLMKGAQLYLIDHEISLAVNQHVIDSFEGGNTLIYYKERHIFFTVLRSSHFEQKRQFFNKFLDKLTNIDMNILDSHAGQLVDVGQHTTIKYTEIKDYLCSAQRNAGKFVELLRGSLN